MQLDHCEIMLLHMAIDQRTEWLEDQADYYGDRAAMAGTVEQWETQILQLRVLSKKLDEERLA